MSQSVCVITGSNSGFGLEVAKMVAKVGGSVVITGRTTKKNETVRQECLDLGASNAIAVTLDVSDPKSVKQMFEQTKQQIGRPITHVFINAGVFPTSCENYALEEDDDVALDEINKTIDINIKGVMYTSRYAFKTLVEQNQGGCVVFTSSVGASMSNGCADILPAGNTIFNLYTSTKTFVDSIARGSTTFLKDHGIRTYTVSPSCYISGMNGNEGDDDTGSVVNPLLKDYSGDPKDVASVVFKMMDGTTRWSNGSNVGCEGPFTYDVHQRYKIMYEPESFGIASPPIPLQSLCDASGQPVTVSTEDLKTIHDEYKAGKKRKE